MAEQSITCPNCGHKFALNEAFVEQFEKEKQKAVGDALKSANEKAKKEREQLKTEFKEVKKTLEREIQDQAEQAAEKKYKLELTAKDEEMKRIQKQLNDLERSTRQGSMELQGEALETHLKSELIYTFPLDNIEDVKKGQAGADLLQNVINSRGQRCGTIVWEAKNTKTWNHGWLDKVKDDAAKVNAQIMVIVSVSLPDNVKTFDIIDGVWVSSVEVAIALATVLRQNLVQAANLQRAMEGMDDKMQAVYVYLTSPQFKNRIQRMVDTWQALQSQVTKEERAMQKQWKERRKQLDTMIDVTTEMYTDVSAIIGAEMPQVEGLTLDALPDGSDGLE